MNKELEIKTSEYSKLSARKIKSIEAFEIKISSSKDNHSMVISYSEAIKFSEFLMNQVK